MPRISCVNSIDVKRTTRVKQLEGMFDVPPSKRSELRWDVNLPLEERDWQIGLIVGPSGCGKSTIAQEAFGDALISAFDWPGENSVVDAFPKQMGIKDITGLLSSVGFSSPPSWLRPFGALSTGEQFRVIVARALAEKPELAVIDEFTSVVDRTVARIASAAVAKSIRRTKRKLVAVSCHYDIIDWLQPDWQFDPSTGEFQWRSLQRRPEIKLDIQRVHRSVWQLFQQHHYLSTDLSKSAKCFLACVEGRPAAFTGVIHRPGSYRGYWSEHRTVCLPDFQGVGIGNALSEFVASLFVATGKRYCSTTSSPAMMRHRAASPLWKMIRKPGFTSKNEGSKTACNGSVAFNRLTAGFKYVGSRLPEEARGFGLPVSAETNPTGHETEPAAPVSPAIPTASNKAPRRTGRQTARAK